jgi:methionine-rich copper-binding protein CopC
MAVALAISDRGALPFAVANRKENGVLQIIPRVRLAFVAGCLIGTPAHAHPELKAADPPVSGAITGSPKEIRMTFSEGVIPKFSGAEVRDQSGRIVASASGKTDPKDKRQLIVPIQQPLPPGTYKVEWHAVSADTHRVQGNYSFRVER